MAQCVYMAISDDVYELPVAVADTIAELSQMIGVKRNAISSAMSKAKKKGFKSRYIKVTLED
ncbi:hypothetical protein [Frisingicoccus sp.]|uniref:hypothetical protein n=1 Tax=Frisingicoccus sp. TaxID=1918627 RepID=UPI00386D82D3